MPKIILAAGGLVLNPNNDVLMIFRRGFWDLPKGKLDAGETIEACAVREVMEETGLVQVHLDRFLLKTQHTYFDKYIGKEVIKETHWYAMHIDTFQNGKPQAEEDIEKIDWVRKDQLSTYLEKSFSTIQEVISAMFL